jgi:nitrate/TMAO reductase-like tetraheme cytochrome c subunit
MSPRPESFFVFAVTTVLGIVLVARPDLTRQRAGKILAFVALIILPALTASMGFAEHWERSKTKQFCLSCHVMEPYGKSLYINDSEYIPAVHYQNNFVPADHACYTCHTTYALYGSIRAKMNGMRHLWVYYTHSAPDTIKLYHPYNNRECLHCHGGSRKFEAVDAHKDTDTTLAALVHGQVSCLTSGCHDVAHEVHSLADAEFWPGPKFPSR